MMRRNVFIGLGAALLALAVAVPVALSHGPGPRGDREGWHQRRGERMAEKLGLDEAQKTRLETLRDAHRADADSLRDQIRAQREAIKNLWTQPNVQKQQILAAEREITALQGQLTESRVDFLFKAKGVLTAEQFAELVEMQGRHGRHHKGGKRGWNKQRGGFDDAPEAPDKEL